jgi:hypothetical protein
MTLIPAFPWALGLLAVVPLVVWLHMRRDPARRIWVPSLQPWRAFATRLAPSRRRLEGGWLLAVHLLGAIGLALGASGLRLSGGGGALAIVLDATPSMAAPGRWEQALNTVARLAAGRDGPVSLVLLGDRPRLLVDRSDDASELTAALRGSEPAQLQDLDRPVDLPGALEMAASLVGDGEVVVVSDGGLAVPEASGGGPTTRLQQVGEPADNWGIAAARFSRANGAPRLFVRLAGRAATPSRRRLQVRADGRLVADLPLDLPAAGERSLVLPLVGAEALEAVSVVLDGSDASAADDRWLIEHPLAGRPVQLVGASRRLTRLLRAWPDIQVISTGTGRMHATDSLALSIVVGGRPAGGLPPGPVLVVGGPDAPGPSQPLAWSKLPLWLASPVSEGLWVRPVPPGPPRGSVVLASAGDRPVLALQTEEGRRVVSLAIDPEAEELAVGRAWPRLLRWSVELALGGGVDTTWKDGDDADLLAADDARALESDLHPRSGSRPTVTASANGFAWPVPWRVASVLAMIALLADAALRAGWRPLRPRLSPTSQRVPGP